MNPRKNPQGTFNSHDAAAGNCTRLQVNCLTLAEKRRQIELTGGKYRPLSEEEEHHHFPEGDGPIQPVLEDGEPSEQKPRPRAHIAMTNTNDTDNTPLPLSQADKDACVRFVVKVWNEITNERTPDGFDLQDWLEEEGIIVERPCNPEENEWGAETLWYLKETFSQSAPGCGGVGG